ncbi:MAG: hypothetical protein PHH70_01855 [Candidatus Gracilibacteria bacterium]|nr:hypothetical protein [Candidatus Gracilibacteria bacterium]
MDKMQFFESLVVPLPDNSGQEFKAVEKIAFILSSIKSDITDTGLVNELELLEREIIFRVWMFERICNNQSFPQKNENREFIGPLIVIVLAKNVLFVNRLYCLLSGMTVSDMQNRMKDNTLYEQIYEGDNLKDAKEAVSRLQSGKGYKQLELTMWHSGEKIAWNSYGGSGGTLDIRSGRRLDNENDQNKERQLHYRGGLMNTTRLIDNVYQICIHEMLSEENEAYLAWIREFLSMFDFLWNHSEFFMETVHVPMNKKGKIHGMYNTVYSQFFGQSFQDKKSFRDIITTSYNMDLEQVIESKISADTPTIQELRFYNHKGKYRADVRWQSQKYPYERYPGYMDIFSFGTTVRSIHCKSIFSCIFEYFFRKK